MKKLTVLALVILVAIACNNAADQQSGPDTTSGLPEPATVDTSRLQADSPNVEKALRK